MLFFLLFWRPVLQYSGLSYWCLRSVARKFTKYTFLTFYLIKDLVTLWRTVLIISFYGKEITLIWLIIFFKFTDEDGDEKWFEQVFSHLSSVKKINLLDSAGNERNITARFVKDYPVGNNDWGDFQTHRKLLGLVSVSEYQGPIYRLNFYIQNWID
jgi:hypothetical protein